MIARDAGIGFIGAGVLGNGLALALSRCGYRVVGASSRRLESAQVLAARVTGCDVFETGQRLANAADVVFITTPDSVITEVAKSIRWRPGQGVVHCCGAASVSILGPASSMGALAGAFHPLQTFAGLDSPGEAIDRLVGVTFAVSGDRVLAEFLAGLADDLGGRSITIADDDRPLYHASAVMACGYLVALMRAAVEFWEEIGFTTDEAVDALYPLARATLENVHRRGLAEASTGPVVRGDTETLHAHLEALFRSLPELVPLYADLVRASLPLGARRGVGPDGLLAIEELVDHYSGTG